MFLLMKGRQGYLFPTDKTLFKQLQYLLDFNTFLLKNTNKKKWIIAMQNKYRLFLVVLRKYFDWNNLCSFKIKVFDFDLNCW